jgi:hypothetical protein
VFGHTEVSGIRFFLWDSQFGRFFNTGPIQNHNGHPLYFAEAFLWTFLPWVGVFIAAVYSRWHHFSTLSSSEKSSLIFLAGAFSITFLLFSATTFQLDHYTSILLPFAAIVCGKYLDNLLTAKSASPVLITFQLGIAFLLPALSIALSLYIANGIVTSVIITLSALMLFYGYINRRQRTTNALLVFPVAGIVIIYTFIVLTSALTFMSISVAYNANKLLANKPPAPIYVYQLNQVPHELGLYNKSYCYPIDNPGQLPRGGGKYYLLIQQAQLASLRAQLGTVTVVSEGHWAINKTGTFNRLLSLAKGTEPLPLISILEINTDSDNRLPTR